MTKQITHLHLTRKIGTAEINTTLCGRVSNARDDLNNTSSELEVTCKLCLRRLAERKAVRS